MREVPASPEGGIIADYTGEFEDPEELALRLSRTVGVVEHGLFGADLVSDVIVARGQHVERSAVGGAPGGLGQTLGVSGS